MSFQELLALYRTANQSCPFCRRIVQRYEKNLVMKREDAKHLETCLISSSHL